MPPGGVVLAWVTVTLTVVCFCGVDESLTVIVVEPIEIPFTFTVEPETRAVALFVFNDSAVMVPVPPVIEICCVPPTAMFTEDGLAVKPPVTGGMLLSDDVIENL